VNAQIYGLCDQGPACLHTSSTRCQNQSAPVFKDYKNTNISAISGASAEFIWAKSRELGAWCKENR